MVKNKKKWSVTNIILTALIVILLGVVGFSGYKLFGMYQKYHHNTVSQNRVSEVFYGQQTVVKQEAQEGSEVTPTQATEHQMTQEEAEQYEKQELEDELSTSDLIKIPDRDVAEVEPDLNNADIKLVTDKNVTNILLIGVDARTNSFVGRSDTMMVCSINKNTNTITLLSLMRDLYVEIEGYKNNKLNASYAFGGTRLLNSTIEKNLGIHIDHDVIINFDGFINAMTEVGDLDISLSKDVVVFLLKIYQ